MSTQHRNFEFRNPPIDGQRPGYYIAPPPYAADGVTPLTQILIGQPVAVDTTQPVDSVWGLMPVKILTGEQPPVKGLSGLADFEFKNDEAFAGFDPALTTFSDLAYVPPSAALKVCSGQFVEVCFRNTSAITFLNTRNYPARTMVAGLSGATPTVTVGSYLTPGVGTDAGGYWAVAANPANGWLVVTSVDSTRGEVTARFLF